MIKVEKFTKVFKLSKKQISKEKTKRTIKLAVDKISFNVNDNEIWGLLGPNGAGKTTTLRCLSTLIKPTEGKLTVQGHDVVKEPEQVRRKIAFLTNELKLDTHFTPRYTMEYFGSLYGMSMEKINQRTEMLFNQFGINDFRDTKISELSTGMKQKLSIAVSLVHDPEVVIFDEPTNGLDIITARAVTDYLQDLKSCGKTIIISTHIMSVASKLCDRISILLNGKIKITGTINQILKETGTDNLEDAFFKLYKEDARERDLDV